MPSDTITSEQVRLARLRAGTTVENAALIVYVSKRTWLRWESPTDATTMPRAIYEFFLLRWGLDPDRAIVQRKVLAKHGIHVSSTGAEVTAEGVDVESQLGW